jgi:hypothetical protein
MGLALNELIYRKMAMAVREKISRKQDARFDHAAPAARPYRSQATAL